MCIRDSLDTVTDRGRINRIVDAEVDIGKEKVAGNFFRTDNRTFVKCKCLGTIGMHTVFRATTEQHGQNNGRYSFVINHLNNLSSSVSPQYLALTEIY